MTRTEVHASCQNRGLIKRLVPEASLSKETPEQKVPAQQTQEQSLPDELGAPMVDTPPLLRRIPVTILMQCVPLPEHRWLDERRQIIGVIPRSGADRGAEPRTEATESPASTNGEGHEENQTRIIRYDTFEITLYVDEADSYYLNISTTTPRCFVIMNVDEESGKSEPLMVTVSADLAASYESVDHAIEVVKMDPAFYPDVEAFVLTHHIPEKFVKRKRKNWSES